MRRTRAGAAPTPPATRDRRAGPGPGAPDPSNSAPGLGPQAPDPGEAPQIALAQIAAALQKRREHRRDTVDELRAALAALAEAVTRHAAMVEDVRHAVEAHGGNLAPLQFYDSIMARLRSELRAAERTLADVFRAAAEGGAAPL